ncbi:MAG: AbgT family transporter [Bacteroidales bacterium]|nr:AbgT family transporter [Bacteroidales bacterium]
MATLLPYSFAFFIVWTILMIICILFGFQPGSDTGLYYSK